MNARQQWWTHLDDTTVASNISGLIRVSDYSHGGKSPDEVAIIEKAREYGASSVFFEAGRNGRASVAQAFVFVAHSQEQNAAFAETHKQLWSWGGVPLAYRKSPGKLELFRCAHRPDFLVNGQVNYRPRETLLLAAEIAAADDTNSSDPWWDAEQLVNGTLWDNPATCKSLLSANLAAHRSLFNAIKRLSEELDRENILPKHLSRKLLILSLLIAYLEHRRVFEVGFMSHFLLGAEEFFEVLADGEALIGLLEALEKRFNGNVFSIGDADRDHLRNSSELQKFSKLVEASEDASGQLTLWKLYSFKDLPVELISNVYQLFVADTSSSIYTPPFLVRFMLEETLSWERLTRITQRGEVILDPACGSGVFLVEAYKRLILHWRSTNNWAKPAASTLKNLLQYIRGIDRDDGAIELAAFSLCLALCDALEPEVIQASRRLFPVLDGKTLHRSCFFDAKKNQLVDRPVGVIIGNPPFTSKLGTPGAENSYLHYQETHGALPDKQLAYLFLHEAMEMVAPGGVLCMLQQYNFLYNQQSLQFRHKFLDKWDVRELLDMVSVRGLFKADTKVVVVIAEATAPPADRKILHATFRRSGRVDAEQGFDIDYYDLHWVSRDVARKNDGIWRANLLGGGRTLTFIDRIRQFRTLAQYAQENGWDYGEGFIAGKKGISRPAQHIHGMPLLPSTALTADGLDESSITTATTDPIKDPKSAKRFTPPMLLIREQMNLPHAVWRKSYLTYKDKIVGFAAPKAHSKQLSEVDQWLTRELAALQAYLAGISITLFTQRATNISNTDIFLLPYPESQDLDLSDNESIVVDDIVNQYRDLVRLGEDSSAMTQSADAFMGEFSAVYARQINAVYKRNPMRALTAQRWGGVVCQPYAFGDAEIEWPDADALKGKLDNLLRDKQRPSLHITRICRIYDGDFVFMLKPDRARYWLKSIALRDADETLADLRAQGF